MGWCKPSWMAIMKNCGHSTKWKKLRASRTLLAMTRKREYIFYDCSAESPVGRRSPCYDREALGSRKEHKPKDNALDLAAARGVELLTEEQYRELQRLGNFDTRTSSWGKHLLISENWVAPSFVITASILSSCITMAWNLTMPPGASAP